MAAIEARLAPVGITPIAWAASQVVQEIQGGTFQAPDRLYLYRIDRFNVLRLLMYGMTALLVVLAGAALRDALGAQTSSLHHPFGSKSMRITTRRRLGRLTSVRPAAANMLRVPTFSSPHVMSCPGSVRIG